ncbi:carboxymuconolactone decarboxylase family protein, partial [Clostridioides difficile]
EGAISKKNKELMGLAISILSRCDECICYHIEGCINSGASKDESSLTNIYNYFLQTLLHLRYHIFIFLY